MELATNLFCPSSGRMSKKWKIRVRFHWFITELLFRIRHSNLTPQSRLPNRDKVGRMAQQVPKRVSARSMHLLEKVKKAF
jgi:hypothetical protein